MHMMAPISTGTLTVVWVRNSIHTMPASAAGRAVMMMKGSSQDWKFTTISRYTRITAPNSPSNRPLKEPVIVCAWPRMVTVLPLGISAAACATNSRTLPATKPRSMPCTEASTSTVGRAL